MHRTTTPMSETDMTSQDADDLEPLEDQEDLEDLEELEELEEPQAVAAPETVTPADSPVGSPAASPAEEDQARRRPGQPAPGEKRELHPAQIHVRKAAIIVAVGSMLPWMTGQDPNLEMGPGFLAKALILVAAWVHAQGAMARHNEKAVGLIKSLAGIHRFLVPGLATIIALVGVFPVIDVGASGLGSWAEKFGLILAGFTFVHVYEYQFTGKFNPVFPLMFLGPAAGGLVAIIGTFSQNLLGGIGAIIVATGGCMACYAMYEALKEAKEEGERKKTLAREARQAARASRKG